ncbi:MAG TPA: MinD/ParA family protein [Syntrophomonadaceae bacterium]|nr:MinD/ParA family protein [Syntrophomonadaceae bacterium]
MKDQAEKLREIALKTRLKIENEILGNLQQTKVIVISSGKGGTGKSTLALNLSMDLSRKGKKIVLLDADMGLANIDIMLGIVPKYNLYHVVTGKKTISDITVHIAEGFDIIPGGSGVYELANLNQDRLKNILVQLGQLDGIYDYMIIDTGAGLSESVLTFLLAADDVIIITTTEPTSITDAYGIVKSLNKNTFAGVIYLVVNRVANRSEGIMTAEKFKLVCKKFLDIEISLLGYVVDESLISVGIRRQQPFITLYPKSIAAKNISMISDSLLENRVNQEQEFKQQRGGIRNFFKKFLSINRQ